VSEGVRVGIDIEKRKAFSFMDLADCFSAEEWEEMAKSENRKATFYDFWTMKESVLKADGRGLSMPMNRVRIKDGRARLDGTTWFLKELDFGPDYSCQLAINAEYSSLEMQKVGFDKEAEPLTIGRLLPEEHMNSGVQYDLT
jgi:4'-phosphopantetheinyl transferase